jgi:hypothetical protein
MKSINPHFFFICKHGQIYSYQTFLDTFTVAWIDMEPPPIGILTRLFKSHDSNILFHCVFFPISLKILEVNFFKVK